MDSSLDSAVGVGSSLPTPAVHLTAITKRYGSVVACADVDLALRAGEIHGVLGENGAGKSTLMKILIGLVQPDAGEIHVAGARVRISDPQTAADLGIGMVHQHLSLVDALTVWENVVLGEQRRLDRGRARDEVAATAERYGLAIDPDQRIGELSAGLRQRVELIKCLRRNPAILILDEPTSILTPAESEQLFTTLRDVVAREGRAVALVSHKLAEIMHATDIVTIMRQGRVVDRRSTSAMSANEMATAMVGREVALRASAAALGATDAFEALDAEDSAAEGDHAGSAAATTRRIVSTDSTSAIIPMLRVVKASASARGVRVLDELSLDVCAGEIVGVAGVEGNGQRALGDLFASLVRLDSGTVLVNGAVVASGRPGAMARAGIGVIPEDRHDSGCVLSMSVADNLTLDRLPAFTRRGLIDRSRQRTEALALMQDFEIQAASPDAPFASLSGGNQQRVILARELSGRPKVLVAAQPTRGLDVGAIEYMSARLRAAAASGIAVLLISTELEEILDLSDRIVVMSRGRMIGEMTRREATAERLGLLLGGVVAQPQDQVA